MPRFAPHAWRRIGRDIKALHDGYTRRDASFAQDANPIHARLAAYQLYFLPRNWFRVQRVLERLPWASGAPRLPENWLTRDDDTDTLHLLDVGCGSGAFSLAWLTHLTPAIRLHGRPLQLHLTLVDQGRRLLELARANIAAYARHALPGVTVICEARADGVQAWIGGPRNRRHYAIAGGAMMLNELDLVGPRRVSDRAAALADALRPQLRPGGCLLFVEPGTRKGYMNLMVLRDRLLELPVLYPCAHDEACPMWTEGVRHWCHATERLPAGFFFDAHLKQRAGVTFEMRDVQLAAIAHQGGTEAAPHPPFQRAAGGRVVSAPMRARPRAARPHKQPQAEPVPATERIVLVCTPAARLEERPAPSGGPYTRGEWLSPSGRR